MTKKIDVSYVAELARLDLTPEEKRLFQAQLETIVGYVDQIASVDVSGVEATMHGQPLVNVMREDEVAPSLDRERFLANAPDRSGAEFRLPKIVEDA
ncbi:MAG: Asp-tRNA(Asn)/Glu-tRNA(Gln) amidotransferase subunit GatC [Kiritimatiellae bacterium]|nr:Asp-tRNA(Asn)/Glu-tRNA(Gln) amidotransferase subunit GatC [Kiritimatiellia bacterium]MDD3544296.1 Asp-tRNA(Asn)/Glu-tRNA(Gln) amidotransferase subunit GatC [Kiritimatiellia bacterium]MDD4025415.1 Asp-tRNA(Asn)/Glu-tRNA(Gln) amidotransferase subunit GatC [Kiritimatiellia bacterium]MDD4621692.1 Asp-tRNA(Asn)/Glu-tRNA(Gln) amidotransferase subunit GatC [Kiritimatiellia bacterium]